MYVPCCRCLECRIRRTSEWVTRITHELHGRDGCFVTLTYSDDNLPANDSLVKDDLQKFIKRLRKYLDKQIKYFACGEYGEKTNRPHYHAIIIGWKPDFKDCYKPGKYWSSKEIEKLWKYGNNTIGTADGKSIQYVVGYVRKKIYGKSKENCYAPRIAPFQLQSMGIGREYAEKKKCRFWNMELRSMEKMLAYQDTTKKSLLRKEAKCRRK